MTETSQNLPTTGNFIDDSQDQGLQCDISEKPSSPGEVVPGHTKSGGVDASSIFDSQEKGVSIR